jgi:uncharacterized protein YtpQ (UPF0354 family)
MNVFVFKTSIQSHEFETIKPILNTVLQHANWNFDFDDCDNILRVVDETNISKTITNCLHQLNHICIELE